MSALHIIVTYIAMASNGIFSSLIGVVWPVMYSDISTDISNAGIATFVLSVSFVIFGMLTEKMNKKMKTEKIVMLGTFILALSQFFISGISSFSSLLVSLFICGMGSSMVDYSLNKYLAVYGAQKEMNWLHSFWGVGALVGPLIASFFIKRGSWRMVYSVSAIIHLGVLLILILSIPLWENVTVPKHLEEDTIQDKPAVSKIPLTFAIFLPSVMISFFAVSVENSTNYWGSTFFSVTRNIPPDHSAKFISVFFAFFMLGRLLAGFLSDRLNNNQMIFSGLITMIIGVVLLLFPLDKSFIYLSVALIGLGNGPIFPAINHGTPERVGYENSQRVIGLQISAAAVSGAITPAFFGWISSFIGMGVFPTLLLIYSIFAFIFFIIMLKQKPVLLSD